MSFSILLSMSMSLYASGLSPSSLFVVTLLVVAISCSSIDAATATNSSDLDVRWKSPVVGLTPSYRAAHSEERRLPVLPDLNIAETALIHVDVAVLEVKPASDSLQARLRRGDIPCRGVNLGGWLVAEQWMTWDSCLWPGVPEEVMGQGEFATMKFLGHEEGDRRFDEHRRTWITEDDIAEMKRFGLNTVRVPVGYWIMGFDPTDLRNKQEWAVFAPHALKYLDKLINHWCVKYDIAVIVDIHAAKGSQNGRDHSAPVDNKATNWSTHPENVDNTVYLATFLASRYRYCPSFLGVGLLNEPDVPTDPHVLQAYYERAYSEIRATGNDCVLAVGPLLTEQRPPFMEDFMRHPNYFNVWHEWHPYFLWGYEGQTRDQVLEAIRRYGDQISSWSGNSLIIDEWSLGAQESAFPSKDRDGLQQFASAQLEAFSKAHSGWVFWSWRHSDDGHNRPTGWSMRQSLRDGVMRLNDA